MRVLFVSHFFPPETAAAASRIYGLAKNLVDLGHQVSVITGFPNYRTGDTPNRHQVKLLARESVSGIDVYRAYVYPSSYESSLSRLLNYFSFVLSSVLISPLVRGRYDAIIVTSPPLSTGISGCVISRLRRASLVLDIRDIWPEIVVAVGQLRKGSLTVRLSECLEQFVYRKADKITVVTQTKREKLIEKGVPPSKVDVISNGIAPEFLAQPIDEAVQDEYKLRGYFALTYAGTIGFAQGVDIIIKAAKDLRAYEDIKFLIIGDGVEKKQVATLAKEYGLSNVTFVDPQPKSRIPSFLAASDVSIVPLKSSRLVDSVPSKLLECMSLGCPVILCADGEARSIVEQSNSGIVVPPEEPQELSKAILIMYHNPALREAFGANGKLFACQNFDMTKIAKKLGTLLENLVD